MGIKIKKKTKTKKKKITKKSKLNNPNMTSKFKGSLETLGNINYHYQK